MSCCNRMKVNDPSGAVRLVSPSEVTAYYLVAPDGTRTRFSNRHAANVENVRLGGRGRVEPATD